MNPSTEPPPMSRAKTIAYAIGLPLGLLALIFWPAGRLWWQPGWVFLLVSTLAFGVSALAIARANPVIFRARSRFQPGTKSWDKALLAVVLPALAAILPVSALDAGRFGWSAMPMSLVLLGYALIVASFVGTAWAQAVNPFFEPGVRIQAERHHRVIDTGPYRIVRHPGYTAALMLFAGMPLALGSWWGLVPAAIAAGVLILRTSWEDRMLQADLPGYRDYAARTRFRLVPGLW